MEKILLIPGEHPTMLSPQYLKRLTVRQGQDNTTHIVFDTDFGLWGYYPKNTGEEATRIASLYKEKSGKDLVVTHQKMGKKEWHNSKTFQYC